MADQDGSVPRWLYLPGTLSLDVVAGGLSMAILSSAVTRTQLPSCYWLILGLAIWSVYTSDHLLDALRPLSKPVSMRHRFHSRYRLPLFMLVTATGSSSVLLAFHCLGKGILHAGIVLGLITGIYLFALFAGFDRRYRWFQKEIAVAFVYTAGIWLAPLGLGRVVSAGQVLIVVATFLTVYANLVMNSWFEQNDDRDAGYGSIATRFGENATRMVFRVSLMLGILLTISVAVLASGKTLLAAALVMLSIQAGLALLFRFPLWSGRGMRYRIISDALYILALLILSAGH